MLIVPAIGWKKGGAGYPPFSMTAGSFGGTVGYIKDLSRGSVSTRDILGIGSLVNAIQTNSSRLSLTWYSHDDGNITLLSAALTGMKLYINGTPYTLSTDYSPGDYFDWFLEGFGAFSNGVTYSMQIAP